MTATSTTASTATATDLNSTTQPSATSGIMGMVPLLLIFVIFYFFMIRPQHRRMREHQNMLGALKRGDQVITGGGIIGSVARIESGSDVVIVEIAPEVKVKVARQSISGLASGNAVTTGTETIGADNKAANKKPVKRKMAANDTTANDNQ